MNNIDDKKYSDKSIGELLKIQIFYSHKKGNVIDKGSVKKVKYV